MSLLPATLRGQMRAYIEHGVPPGAFLTALLAGQPRDAFDNVLTDPAINPRTIDAELPAIMEFRRRFVPEQAYGTQRRVMLWVARGGLYGRNPPP